MRILLILEDLPIHTYTYTYTYICIHTYRNIYVYTCTQKMNETYQNSEEIRYSVTVPHD